MHDYVERVLVVGTLNQSGVHKQSYTQTKPLVCMNTLCRSRSVNVFCHVFYVIRSMRTELYGAKYVYIYRPVRDYSDYMKCSQY